MWHLCNKSIFSDNLQSCMSPQTESQQEHSGIGTSSSSHLNTRNRAPRLWFRQNVPPQKNSTFFILIKNEAVIQLNHQLRHFFLKCSELYLFAAWHQQILCCQQTPLCTNKHISSKNTNYPKAFLWIQRITVPLAKGAHVRFKTVPL